MKTKLPSFVSILILTLITSFAWLSFSVYRALTIKPTPVVPREVSEALTPTLDMQTLEKLRSKEFFEDFEIPEITTRELPGRRDQEEVVAEEEVVVEEEVEETEPTAPPDEPIVEETE